MNHDPATKMRIETDRLQLLPFTPDQLLALIEQPERFEELSGFSAAAGLHEFFASDEVSPAYLASLRTMAHADPWRLGFAIVHRQTRAAIGGAGFKGPPDADGVVEVAYGIVSDFQGSGYATEANMALVEYAIASGLVRVVRAHTMPTPNASTRVLAKCDFQFTGEVVDPDDGLVWRWERGARERAQGDVS